MLQKHLWALLLFVCALTGCSENKERSSIIEEVIPSAFESVLNESEELILLLNNSALTLDSSSVEPYIISHDLKPFSNGFRTEASFGDVTLKKIFKCDNGIISVVHFDFYYDSLNPDLEQDSKALLELLQKNLGDFSSTHSDKSMKTFSWLVASSVLDYELFDNGFTFTARKNQTIIIHEVVEKETVKKLKPAAALIRYIHNDSIGFDLPLFSGIQNSFDVSFKSKSNAVAFSETYNENILLSGSFHFNGENLIGVYFDYVYSDSTSKEFIEDAKAVRNMISNLYGTPSEVATVPLSTSYKWNKTPLIVEVYGDGFSILFEKESL
jgi:hypothetical protein